MKTLLTIIAISIILIPYLLYRFVCNPVGCIRQMINDWKFVNGDLYGNSPAHTEKKEKKAKRQSKSTTS